MLCPTPVICQFSIVYPHYISSLFRSAPLQLYESLRSSNSNQPLDYRWVFTSCLRGVTSPEWGAVGCWVLLSQRRDVHGAVASLQVAPELQPVVGV